MGTAVVTLRYARHALSSYKALCGVVHDAQLEPVLLLVTASQSVPQVVRGEGRLSAVLELGEEGLGEGGREPGREGGGREGEGRERVREEGREGGSQGGREGEGRERVREEGREGGRGVL